MRPRLFGVLRRCSTQWRGQDSNLRRQSHVVYSHTPLTAREPRQGSASVPSRAAAMAANSSSGSTSYGAYFGPPSKMPVPPSTASEGMNQRRPSPTWTKRKSTCAAARRFTKPRARTPSRVGVPARASRTARRSRPAAGVGSSSPPTRTCVLIRTDSRRYRRFRTRRAASAPPAATRASSACGSRSGECARA
jgi:hypothetical protein